MSGSVGPHNSGSWCKLSTSICIAKPLGIKIPFTTQGLTHRRFSTLLKNSIKLRDFKTFCDGNVILKDRNSVF